MRTLAEAEDLAMAELMRGTEEKNPLYWSRSSSVFLPYQGDWWSLPLCPPTGGLPREIPSLGRVFATMPSPVLRWKLAVGFLPAMEDALAGSALGSVPSPPEVLQGKNTAILLFSRRQR